MERFNNMKTLRTSKFSRLVQRVVPEKKESTLSEEDLQECGLTGINLRNHQLKGVRWLIECMKTFKGCILGDEMGLGKTCQAISLLLYARGHLKIEGPFLVLCPLTVLENWQDELTKISPSLSVICYHGEKQERENLQKEMNEKKFDVLLTHYTLCRIDASVLRRWTWEILVVDEAQEIKNLKSKLHQILTEFNVNFKLLLTGTPIQNNVREVYSLLTFIQPLAFPPGAIEDFVNTYQGVKTGSSQARDLHEVIRPFLLRRMKAAVETNLPKKEQILIHHGMSALQKIYYKAILMKDLSVIEGDKGGQNRLLNILMQLRKCVNHPYLFNGVEPEPYEIGEHLVEASGKLSLLDKMLAFLSDNGHRVLLFSQMTRMLDIVQDYLEYRGYSYERVDGSVRREERNLSIRNFKTKDIFILLLSTKAGGVGLNLTEADTVIFLDNDFNPQNDLQALSRSHRIGQTRPVKVIRLCGRDTVEEIILSRAASKLRLTDTVIEEGHFSQMDNASDFELKEILSFGTSRLLSTDESFVLDVDLEESLGRSENGKWLIEEKEEEEEENITAAEDEDENRPHQMYSFEGMDYSKVPSTEDKNWIACRLVEQSAVQEDTETEGHHLRSKTRALFSESLPSTSRIKRCLTESELEERRRKKEESSAKRARVLEEKKKQREDQKYKKKMAWWESCGYRSLCLPSADCEGEDEDVEVGNLINGNFTDTDDTEISYVLGDVTHPEAKSEDAIIVHCVDDSGHWGQGGLFTALVSRSDEVKKQYELAGDMEDLELGRVLMFPIDDKQSRACGTDYLALIVSQKRDKDNNLSGILLSALDEGLMMISRVAKQKKASVHLPRIGHDTKGFNWYGTERLIRKHLASRGVSTFIYYFKRADSHSSSSSSSGSSPIPSTSRDASGFSALPAPVSPGSSGSLDPPGPSGVQPKSSRESSSSSGQGGEAPGLPEFMRGVHVHFYNMGATERKKLARHLIAYDGDEEDLMSRMVTHVVAEVENPVHIQDLQEMSQQYPQAILVKKKWLESCFAHQRKVAVSKFLHRF